MTFLYERSYLHTIRKVKYLSKNSILTKPQHFHEFFTPKIDNFHGKSKLNFWTKNEDFEQCEIGSFHKEKS